MVPKKGFDAESECTVNLVFLSNRGGAEPCLTSFSFITDSQCRLDGDYSHTVEGSNGGMHDYQLRSLAHSAIAESSRTSSENLSNR